VRTWPLRLAAPRRNDCDSRDFRVSSSFFHIKEGKPMVAHKFKAGQQVIVAPHRPSGVTGGTFKIVRVLPEERGVWQYRVKSVADGHERVVLESDLTH